jgi:hypothetical protein
MDLISATCDEKARKKFMQKGGDVETWEMAKDDGAMETGAKMLESCFDKSFAAAGYSWDGLCLDDATNVCWQGGWASDGTMCECQGLATEAQIQKLQDECDEKAMKAYKKSGGDSEDWEQKKIEGAVKIMGDSLKTCYSKQMENRGYKWTGTCGEPAEACKLDRLENVGRVTVIDSLNFDKECTCVGTITDAQMLEIETTCDDKARKDFMKSGGDPEDFDSSKLKASTKTYTATHTTCADKLLKAKGVSLEGICKGSTTDKCVGGYMVLPPYKVCECEGAATPAQMDEIFKACMKKASEAFVIGGGSTGGQLAGVSTIAAENLLEASTEKCFKKQLKASGATFTGTCNDDTAMPCDASSECECVGAATAENIDAVHHVCDVAVMTDFVRAGKFSRSLMQRSMFSMFLLSVSYTISSFFVSSSSYRWETC